ncbi:MAG: branched-chain amino acid ABC transporter permease [Dehalococcoidia bacterium]|nr:branched-chain amino acid ABC transporter permease [Dehalococcoidia bacterium]
MISRLSPRLARFRPAELIAWLALAFGPLILLSVAVLTEDSFSLFSRQVAAGLASGSLYAIVALALVLIYRSTDIVNFGQGEMAMLSTFFAWSFLNTMELWAAIPLTLAVAFMMGAIIERVVIRRVENAPVLNAVIVTLGLFVICNGLANWIYGPIPRPFPSPFAELAGNLGDSDTNVSIGEVTVAWHSVGVFATALCLTLLLFVFFQRTKLGLAVRAAAQNPVAARLVGIRVNRMLTLGWAMSSMVGALAGMLVAHILQLDFNLMLTVLIFAFAAAVLGGLDSPLGAVLGGLIIGVVENLAGALSFYDIGQIKTVVAFLAIVGVLVIRPTGLLGKRGAQRV